MRCPFCNSPEVEVVSAWGAQLMTAQMRCAACNSHFESVREDFAHADERGEDASGRAP